MVSVGIRELKSRLSYYVQLAQAGETIAVMVRNRIVSFLSDRQPSLENRLKRRHSRRDSGKLIQDWKRRGFLISGGLCRHRPFKPIPLAPGPTTTEMIRGMRDERT